MSILSSFNFTTKFFNISKWLFFTINKKIVFDNVTFKYGEKIILNKINFIIHKNKLNVISGPSGTGKTSMIDLLTRLHTPYSGEIKVDNLRLEDINLKKWRNSISYIGQEDFLLNDNLRNNILNGISGVSDSKIWEILKIVEAHEFVLNLDNQLDTSVGERGLKLSGGQRQRIFLARGLIRKPNLLILDEATVGLEESIEKKICKNLKSIASSVTIVAITHQKALLRYADNVYKMQ